MTKLSYGVLTLVFAMNSMAGLFENGPNLLNFAPKEGNSNSVVGDADRCSNFSGTWKGTCAGKTNEETFTATQNGCTSLYVKEFPVQLFIGSDNAYITTMPVTTQGGGVVISNVFWSASWNADKSALTLNLSSNVRTVPIVEGVNYILAIKAEIKLDGDKLVTSSQEVGKPVEVCTYTKQS